MELLNKRTASLVLIGALGLTAVGLEAAGPQPDTSITNNLKSNTAVEYFPDGTRLVHLNGTAVSNLHIHPSFADVYEACNGKDLVKDVIGYRSDLIKGGPTVSVNDPECATGKLTDPDLLAAK